MRSPRLGRLAAASLLVGAGLAVALGPLSPEVVVDRNGDWRQLCVGCRRAGGTPGGLALKKEALVHVHRLDGSQQALELWLQAQETPVRLEIADSPDDPPLLAAQLGPSPQRLSIPLAADARDVELWLRASPDGSAQLDRIVLARARTAFDRVVQWLPLICGMLAFAALTRSQPPARALLLALAALAVAALAALVLHDSLGLLELRAGPRERVQTALVAALAGCALLAVPGRRLAVATLAGVSWLLFLPSVNNGLVSDDFLWARTWTLGDVASTFWGSEDPAGKSNVYYRPISASAHAVDSWVWGSSIVGYHVTNLLLHPVVGAVALLLLERLGLSRRAALLGALAWAVHPMSASAVAWISQRTDLIASFFYLAALFVLLSPLGRRGWPPLVPAALALGSKELAISLPAIAALVVWLRLDAVERRRRLAAVAGLVLLAVVHATWWVRLFPEVAGYRIFGDAGRAADDAGPGLLRGLAGVAAEIAWPAGYEAWWSARQGAPGAVTVLACAAFPLLALWLRRCPPCRDAGAGAAAVLAVAWPLLVALPLFGIRLVDFYRLGFIPCFGFALAAGALGHHLEHRASWRVVPLAAVLAAWLAPLALDTAEEWGPNGFYYEMSLTLERRLPDWERGLSPLALGLYHRQLAASDHLRQVADRIEP